MFYGEYEHSLDKKGRIILPSKLREALKETFVEKCVMTKGLEGCLFLYPLDEWRLLEQKVKALPMTGREARAFSRQLLSGASECILDKQGRVFLPQNLRQYAGISREVVIIGVSNRMEIWSKDKWLTYAKETQSSYEDIAEKLVDKGI